jgi:tRNA G26 N,N-dimethylase Trm1
MHVEGKAKFKVGNAFYRPKSRVARDLGVLAAAIYRFDTGSLQVLDAMAGCGVCSLRYWKESLADWVWANEGNPEHSSILHQNLEEAIAASCCQITHLDANQVFFDCYNRSNFYDLVDIDGFGSPAPFYSTSLWAVKIGGLLYLTSTDGRTATGHSPKTSLSVYGAYARAHPAAHEQGLRLLIGAVQQQAAAKRLGIEPVFSTFPDLPFFHRRQQTQRGDRAAYLSRFHFQVFLQLFQVAMPGDFLNDAQGYSRVAHTSQSRSAETVGACALDASSGKGAAQENGGIVQVQMPLSVPTGKQKPVTGCRHPVLCQEMPQVI